MGEQLAVMNCKKCGSEMIEKPLFTTTYWVCDWCDRNATTTPSAEERSVLPGGETSGYYTAKNFSTQASPPNKLAEVCYAHYFDYYTNKWYALIEEEWKELVSA